MNKEKLIAKGVARKYENGEVLFNVESLHEHYDGINYHLTDILEGGFIRSSDLLDEDIREIEVFEVSVDEPEEVEVIEPEVVGTEIVAPEVIVAETPEE